LRGALGFMDDRIWINNDKNVTGSIRVKYDALSCRPGLPTTPQATVTGGSRQRFESGAIYRNTKASKTVWLFGDIYAKYRQMKENASLLGMPTSSVQTLVTPAGCDQAVCQKASFDGGSIFFKADTGAHEVHGAVLDYLNSHGGVAGRLGFPTTDVTVQPNGHTQATFQGKPGGAPISVNCAADGTCSESSGS
jgi:uncharacterized protein with LGFP repeats